MRRIGQLKLSHGNHFVCRRPMTTAPCHNTTTIWLLKQKECKIKTQQAENNRCNIFILPLALLRPDVDRSGRLSLDRSFLRSLDWLPSLSNTRSVSFLPVSGPFLFASIFLLKKKIKKTHARQIQTTSILRNVLEHPTNYKNSQEKEFTVSKGHYAPFTMHSQSITILCHVYWNNSCRINVYRFRAFWLDKSTVTCLFLIRS